MKTQCASDGPRPAPMASKLAFDASDLSSAYDTPTATPRTPRPATANAAKLNLSIGTIIGTTASSATGFTCLPKAGCYAACAGSAAVVGYVDEELNVRQKTFRAGPETTTSYANGYSDNVSAPSTPDFRRPRQTLGGALPNSRSTPSVKGETVNSPGKGPLRTRTRLVTCVSCSPDGKVLALGEVIRQIWLKFESGRSLPADRLCT